MAEGDNQAGEKPSQRLAALESNMASLATDVGGIKASIAGINDAVKQAVASAVAGALADLQKTQASADLGKRRAAIAETFGIEPESLDVFATAEALDAHEQLLKAAHQRGTALPAAKPKTGKEEKEFDAWAKHEEWKAQVSAGRSYPPQAPGTPGGDR